MAASRESGFTLLEAMVALAITAMVVLAFLGVRTQALVDATGARNWRLARELAEAKLSELRAGAIEVRPESGTKRDFDDMKGWSYTVLVGESAISAAETELLSEQETGGDSGDAAQRATWQRNRDDYRKADQMGLSYQEFEEQRIADQEELERQDKAPSEDDIEDVAVVVHFPRVSIDKDGFEFLMLKAKVSTLALSGMTPEQAKQIADSQNSGNTGSGSGTSPLAPGDR